MQRYNREAAESLVEQNFPCHGRARPRREGTVHFTLIVQRMRGAMLEESEELEEQVRGTPLVPEMYFGGDGSDVAVYLFAASGPLGAPAKEVNNKPKFVCRDPFATAPSPSNCAGSRPSTTAGTSR